MNREGPRWKVLGVGGGDDGDTAVGASLCPFLGYKIAARFGQTFEESVYLGPAEVQGMRVGICTPRLPPT